MKKMKKIILFPLICSISLLSCYKESIEDDTDISQKEQTQETKVEETKEDNNQNEQVIIDLKNPTPLEINNELYPDYNSFTIDKYDVELDCGIRTNYSLDSIQSCFNKTITINANWDYQEGYTEGDLKVYWFIDEIDNPYFALHKITNTNGNSSVTIYALKESRIATLTAALVEANDITKVIKVKKCQLRSVMTNLYSISELTVGDHYAGLNVSNIISEKTGYSVSMFNSEYSEDRDIVIPSQIKSNNVTRPIYKFEFLATSSGESIVHNPFETKCRNLYIPNSVFSIDNLVQVEPNNNLIFEDGNINFLFIKQKGLAYGQTTPGSDSYLYNCIAGLNDLKFPYNKYYHNVNVDGESLPTDENSTTSFELNKETFKEIIKKNLTGNMLFTKE